MNTTKATHTPGPWSNTPMQDTIWANDGETKIATVADLPWITSPAGRRQSDWETEQANAKLIAAAPALLAALSNLVHCCERDFYSSESPLAQARAAIAKATGCTP
jgi:hypothetical protein